MSASPLRRHEDIRIRDGELCDLAVLARKGNVDRGDTRRKKHKVARVDKKPPGRPGALQPELIVADVDIKPVAWSESELVAARQAVTLVIAERRTGWSSVGVTN